MHQSIQEAINYHKDAFTRYGLVLRPCTKSVEHNKVIFDIVCEDEEMKSKLPRVLQQNAKVIFNHYKNYLASIEFLFENGVEIISFRYLSKCEFDIIEEIESRIYDADKPDLAEEIERYKNIGLADLEMFGLDKTHTYRIDSETESFKNKSVFVILRSSASGYNVELFVNSQIHTDNKESFMSEKLSNAIRLLFIYEEGQTFNDFIIKRYLPLLKSFNNTYIDFLMSGRSLDNVEDFELLMKHFRLDARKCVG